MRPERRRFQRSETCLIVEFRKPDLNDVYSVGITRNLSHDGLSIESDELKLKPGNVLDFTLKHPHTNLAVPAHGQIVWKKEAWYQIISGIKLSDTDSSYQRKLSDLISSADDVEETVEPTAVEDRTGSDHTPESDPFPAVSEPETPDKTELPRSNDDRQRDRDNEDSDHEKSVLHQTLSSVERSSFQSRNKYQIYILLAALGSALLFFVSPLTLDQVKKKLSAFFLNGKMNYADDAGMNRSIPADAAQAANNVAGLPAPPSSQSKNEESVIPGNAAEEQARAGGIREQDAGEFADYGKILTVLGGGSINSGQIALNNKMIKEIKSLVPEILSLPGKQVLIEGHTSNAQVQPSTGEKYRENMKLSVLRAEAVAALLSQQGVPAERIIVKGYGDTLPLASNEIAEGRARNRRIEIKLLP